MRTACRAHRTSNEAIGDGWTLECHGTYEMVHLVLELVEHPPPGVQRKVSRLAGLLAVVKRGP
jgi:hypothetical protein